MASLRIRVTGRKAGKAGADSQVKRLARSCYLHSVDYLFAFYLAAVCKLLDHHQLILTYNLLLMTRPNLNGGYEPRLCENGRNLRDVRKGC